MTSELKNEKPQLRSSCPNCRGGMRAFFEFNNVPTNSCVLLDNVDEATSYPRGDIVLGFCDDCAFICNLSFDAKLTEYSARYEETQGYSPTFRKFHEGLVQQLISRHGVFGKHVLEIGCGKGEFLEMICRQGRNSGIGFDPGFDEKRQILNGLNDVEVVTDFYSGKYSHYQADLVCCKMTLEHIEETGDFARLAHQAMRPTADSLLYFMVPEATRILEHCAFEDIYYEHCSYFTPGSLARLFRNAGFTIERLGTEYSDQYLTVEARLKEYSGDQLPLNEERDLVSIRGLVDSFAARCQNVIDAWRTRLERAASSGPIAVWGSGSKAVAFLGAVDPAGLISTVVDINPHRQGHYMPGSGQKIVAPADLVDTNPSTVIVMNSVYRDEICQQIKEFGLSPSIATL